MVIPPSGRATILLTKPPSDVEPDEEFPFIMQVSEADDIFGTETAGPTASAKDPDPVADPLPEMSLSRLSEKKDIPKERIATTKYVPKKSSGKDPIHREHKVLEPVRGLTSAEESPMVPVKPSSKGKEPTVQPEKREESKKSKSAATYHIPKIQAASASAATPKSSSVVSRQSESGRKPASVRQPSPPRHGGWRSSLSLIHI